MHKYIIPFLFLVNLAVAQSPLEKRLDFSVDGASMDAALLKLSNLCETDIAFSGNFFKNKHDLTISVKNEKVQKVLDQLLADTDITYKALGDRIVLFKKKYYTISGYIEDKDSGERLIAATVYCPTLKKGTVTNEYGFYSLTLPEGETKLNYSYLGFEVRKNQIHLDKNIRQKIQLKNTNTLSEVLITAKEQSNPVFGAPEFAPFTTITKEQVAISPDLGGELDPIRTAQLLPGIQSGADGLDGIFVRGGDNGQNLMLLDGAPVYIPYHLLGVFSIYNHETINSTAIYKGSFPARYGGRLSSIFDVRTREGNQYEWNGSVGANLISTNALIEGPIKKGKGAILLAGRKSYSGFLFNPFFRQTYFRNDAEGIQTNFLDWNAKLNYTITPKDRLYLSFYNGSDQMGSFSTTFEDELIEEREVALNWSNRITTFRWNHIYNDKLFSNATFTYSSFNYEYTVLEEFSVEKDEEEFDLKDLYYVDLRSINNDIGISLDFNYWLSAIHQFRFGGGISFKDFAPGLSYFEEDDEEIEELEKIDIDEFDRLLDVEKLQAAESHIYLEDQINIENKLLLNLGLRASGFLTADQNYFRLEPRMTLTYKVNPKLTARGGLSKMVQYLHLISYSNIRLPNDLWVPSDEELLPGTSWLSELGLTYKPFQNFSLSVDYYYKRLENLYTYPQGFEFDEVDFREFLISGNGKSEGIETLLEYSGTKTGGHFSYTFNKVRRTFSKINEGQPFAPNRDQPHQLKLFLYFKPNTKFSFGLNWVFNSNGKIPEIQPLGTEQIELDENIDKSIEKPSEQISFDHYHRLDLSVSYHFSTQKIQHLLKIGAYNLYNRSNLAFYRLEFNQNEEVSYRPVRSLMFRPSVSYRVKF